MRKPVAMISVLLSGLLLLPLGALAQDAATEEPEREEATEESTEAQAEPEPEPEPASTRSPFEYEASEQISEDLSVSFPVDI